MNNRTKTIYNTSIYSSEWAEIDDYNHRRLYAILGFRTLGDFLGMRVYDFLNMNQNDSGYTILDLYNFVNPNNEIDEAIYYDAIEQPINTRRWIAEHGSAENITIEEIIFDPLMNKEALNNIFNSICRAFYKSSEYTGESQRPNGTYMYRWTDAQGKRHYIYAPTLEKLREEEKLIIVDEHDGIKQENKLLTLNDLFELWKDTKRGIKDSTFQNYIYMYNLIVAPNFGKNRVQMIKKSDVKKFYNRLADGKRMQIATIDNIHSLLVQLLVSLYAKQYNMRVATFDDNIIGLPLETYIPDMLSAIERINKKTGNENERVVKEHLCKMNGITYFEVSANNRLELADKIKRIFREKNIYILSDSQEDIEQCKKAFLRWKDKTQQ